MRATILRNFILIFKSKTEIELDFSWQIKKNNKNINFFLRMLLNEEEYKEISKGIYEFSNVISLSLNLERFILYFLFGILFFNI